MNYLLSGESYFCKKFVEVESVNSENKVSKVWIRIMILNGFWNINAEVI